MKKITLFLAFLCCLYSSPLVHSRESRSSGVPVVSSYDDLRELLEGMSMNLETETRIRPTGVFKSRKTSFKNLNYYGFYDFATHYYYEWRSDSPYIKFRVTLADNAILYAAYRNSSLRRKLSRPQQRALRAAEECVERVVKPGMSREEIVKALHDEVAAICSYDRGNICNQSCVSVFNLKKGACGAYTRTLSLLLAMNDIRSYVIQGREKSGGPHCWNLIEMEPGKWYHVDVTWDDTKPLTHKYFCLTDDQIKRDHRWDATYYPATPER